MKEFWTLPKQLKLGELLRFVSIVVGSSIFPFMTIYYVKYFGTLITGILTIIVSIAAFLGSLYGGHLTDSIGRKKMILIGLSGAAVGWLISILSNIPGHISPWTTFLGFLVIEIFYGLYSPAYDAMLIDLTDETNRRFVYTIGYWFVNMAVMFGAGISGLFYDHYFIELMAVDCAITILIFICVWLYFSETKSQDVQFDHGVGLKDTFKNYGEVLKDRPFLLYTIASILSVVVWMQVDNLLPVTLALYFKPVHIFGVTITSTKMLSLAVFTNTILIVFLMTTVNKLTKKMALRPQLILGTLVFSFGMLLAFSFHEFYLILLSVVIYTVGEMINVPASQVLRVDMMDDNKVGSYSGFVAMAQPLGNILAGGLVSLYYFTGLLGVQIVFVVITFLGLFLLISSIKMKLGNQK